MPPLQATGDADSQREQIDALDVLIGQEREVTAQYVARQTRADATAAAAVTAVFALTALTATNASSEIDKPLPWILLGLALAVIGAIALAVRTVAGLRHRSDALLSSESKEFEAALDALRECGPNNLNPIDVRQRALALCRARARDAHRAAKAKDISAAAASALLALTLVAIFLLLLTV